MSTVGDLSRLRIDTGAQRAQPATFIEIDGVDVLALHHEATLRVGPPSFMPAIPAALLPPDSSALLATTLPRQAMIGMCTCGEAGCSSLWLQVRRDANTVVWEPDPHTRGSTINTSWTFGLRQYLDAVDAGQRSTQKWETQSLRVARELRRRRDSLSGQCLVDPTTRTLVTLLDAYSWPGSDEIEVRVAGDAGVRHLTARLEPDLSDDEQLQALLHGARTVGVSGPPSPTVRRRGPDRPAGR